MKFPIVEDYLKIGGLEKKYFIDDKDKEKLYNDFMNKKYQDFFDGIKQMDNLIQEINNKNNELKEDDDISTSLDKQNNELTTIRNVDIIAELTKKTKNIEAEYMTLQIDSIKAIEKSKEEYFQKQNYKKDLDERLELTIQELSKCNEIDLLNKSIIESRNLIKNKDEPELSLNSLKKEVNSLKKYDKPAIELIEGIERRVWIDRGNKKQYSVEINRIKKENEKKSEELETIIRENKESFEKYKSLISEKQQILENYNQDIILSRKKEIEIIENIEKQKEFLKNKYGIIDVSTFKLN